MLRCTRSKPILPHASTSVHTKHSTCFKQVTAEAELALPLYGVDAHRGLRASTPRSAILLAALAVGDLASASMIVTVAAPAASRRDLPLVGRGLLCYLVGGLLFLVWMYFACIAP